MEFKKKIRQNFKMINLLLLVGALIIEFIVVGVNYQEFALSSIDVLLNTICIIAFTGFIFYLILLTRGYKKIQIRYLIILILYYLSFFVYLFYLLDISGDVFDIIYDVIHVLRFLSLILLLGNIFGKNPFNKKEKIMESNIFIVLVCVCEFIFLIYFFTLKYCYARGIEFINDMSPVLKLINNNFLFNTLYAFSFPLVVILSLFIMSVILIFVLLKEKKDNKSYALKKKNISIIVAVCVILGIFTFLKFPPFVYNAYYTNAFYYVEDKFPDEFILSTNYVLIDDLEIEREDEEVFSPDLVEYNKYHYNVFKNEIVVNGEHIKFNYNYFNGNLNLDFGKHSLNYELKYSWGE